MRNSSRLRKFFRFASARNIPWGYVGLGALSSTLLVMSFPPVAGWGLIFVGFVPFLLGVALAPSAREVAWLGFSQSVFFLLGGFHWISFVVTNFGGLPWIVGVLVVLIFSIFAELQFFFFGLIAYALFRAASERQVSSSRWARAFLAFLVLPLVYVGLDYLNPKIFPSTLGHALYGWLSVAQIAEFGGVFILTFPVLVANFAVASLVLAWWRKLRPARFGAAGQSVAVVFPGPLAACLALLLLGAGLFFASEWGTRRIAALTDLKKTYTKKLKFSVIQGNIGDIDKLSSEKGYEPAVQKVLSTYRDATLASVRAFHPDLVIWPETAYPFLYTHFADDASNRSGAARDQWIKTFMTELNTPLFFGAYSSQGKRDFNTAFLVKPPFELAATYRKSILLAFGEYVPLGPLSPLIQNIVPTIADFGRGPGPIVVDVKGVKLGPQICYEGIFPEHSRGAAKLGADILLNITNDSWFGRTHEPNLHLLLTLFRTIELRRPMIRGTNTGISTVVDITGEMRWSTRLFEPASIDAELAVPGEGQRAPETFYSRHGELFAAACAVVALVAACYAFGPLILVVFRKLGAKAALRLRATR